MPATDTRSWAPWSPRPRTTEPPPSCTPSHGFLPRALDELFAAQVAYAYIHASGIRVKVGSQEAIALVSDAVEGRRDVRQVADALKNWG